MAESKKYEPCINPFVIYRREVGLETGVITDSSFEKRCGARRKDKCAPCSKVWKDDAYFALVRGAQKHMGAVTFLTFTAPGSKTFGKSHTAQYQRKVSERCSCRSFHKPDDELVGLPIKSDQSEPFAFKKIVEFNNVAPRLTAVTLQKIWRLMATELNREEREVRMPYARVMEWQERGVLHTHIIVLGHIPTYIVEKVINGSPPTKNRRRVLPTTHKGYRWGEMYKVQHINSGDSSQAKKLSGYVTKLVSYALKDVAEDNLTTNSAKNRYRAQLRKQSNKVIKCDKPYSVCCLTKSEEIKNIRFQAKTTRLNYCVRHRRGHHQLGFTGNVLSINRKWGYSLKSARQTRAQFARKSSTQDAVKASCVHKEKKLVTYVVQRKQKFQINESSNEGNYPGMHLVKASSPT
jgi:hypothetical protein